MIPARTIDHIVTSVPARHTEAVLVVEIVVCLAIAATLVTFVRTRSRWAVASCAPLVALAVVIGCYGYANDVAVTNAQYPSEYSIAVDLGLRSSGDGGYYDLDGHTYTDCDLATNTLDDHHVVSKMSCILNGRRVTITTKKD